MNLKQRRFASAALLLFIGAALFWFQAEKILRARRLVVVDHPIRLEAGLAFSYPFNVEIAGNYQIELTCRRILPAAILAQALSKDLVADYEISTGNDRVAGGDSSQAPGSGGTSDVASRLIGKFTARPNHLYLLRVHFSNSLPVLAATQPTIKVSVDSSVSGPIYARAQLASTLALICAVLGVGCLPLAFARSFLRRRAVPG